MSDRNIPIFFAAQSYKARSGLLSAERVVNLYAEDTIYVPESKSKVALFRTPGALPWKNLENYNPIYGMIVMGEFLYVVCGLSLYKINTSMSANLIGTLSTAPDRVQMTENGTQVTILTSSGISYYYNVNTNTFGQITSPNYKSSISVTTLDGYTIFAREFSQEFFISANNDTTTYAALDFASAEAKSDNLLAVLNYNRQLVLFGSTSIEFWYDTGNQTFPFERIDGALIDKGTAATNSAVGDVTGFYFLGSDKIIYQCSSYQPQRISTYGVEKAINSYERINDAFAFIYTQEGHKFYCLTFPSANKTWCYDINTKLWHERESRNALMQVNRWIANCHASFANKELIGSNLAGKIYELNLDYAKEDQNPLICEAISATQFYDYYRTSFNKFILWMDTGVGIDGSGQGDNPQIMLQVSTDGGKTWSNELWQALGEIGQYDQEVWWDQIGFGRNLLLKIIVSDPVKVAINGALLNLTIGRS